jgi:hypothetical protein
MRMVVRISPKLLAELQEAAARDYRGTREQAEYYLAKALEQERASKTPDTAAAVAATQDQSKAEG